MTVMVCPMVWLSTAIAGPTPTHTNLEDSIPGHLVDRSLTAQPVLKSAVVNAINSRIADVPDAGSKSTVLPFEKMGLGGLHAGARTQFVQYMQAGNTSTGIANMQKTFDGMKDSTRRQQYIDNKLRGFYALKDQQGQANNFTLPGKPENKVKGISWQTTYSDSTALMSGWWNEGAIQDVITIGSIPFQLNYSTLSGYDYTRTSLQDAHFGKVAFDKDAYMDKINQQLQKKYDLQKYFLEDLDVKSSIRKYAADQLAHIKSGGDSSSQSISADQMMYLDSTQLSNLLQKNGDTTEYYNKIMALKKQMGGVEEMNKLLGSQKQVSGGVESWMQQPQHSSKVAERLLRLSSIQRLMLYVKDFQVGSIGTNASKGSMSDLFMTGAAGSFLKGNKFIMLAAGKRNEMGIQETGLQSATGNASYSMQFLRIGRGDIGSKQSHVSILNANAKPQQQYGFNTTAISRNIFVGSVSQQISLGELGTVDFELSKSSAQSANNSQEAAAVSKSAATHLLDNMWATASIGMAYNGDVKKLGLSQKVYFNYSGLGYVNPGTPFASRGTLQYGFMARRSWMRNKAMISLRTDVRNLAVSPVSNDRRRSLQYAFDARYRFTRRFALSMNVLQNTLKEISEEKKNTAFLNRKISFMSQANGKIAGKSFNNNSSIGLQQLNYLQPDAPVKSLFVNASSMQTWMAGPGMVLVSAIYSRDVKNAAIYNNLLNTEAGYQYSLWKLSCSSTFIYMDSKDVVTQIGLRQQIAAQLLKRWYLSVSADGRQNLRNTAANYYYGRFNTALSLHYQIN